MRQIQDISLLIVPSVEILATCGATYLQSLIESTNKCWKYSIPFCGPCSQPDYAVGFRWEAFTKD